MNADFYSRRVGPAIDSLRNFCSGELESCDGLADFMQIAELMYYC